MSDNVTVKGSTIKGQNYDEEKKVLEVNQFDPSSYSPYIKHNKLSVYEGKKAIGKIVKSHHKAGQVKPTQFHYP